MHVGIKHAMVINMTTEQKNLQVRIPVQMHDDLKTIAFIKRTTVKEMVTKMLEDLVENDETLKAFKRGHIVMDTDSVTSVDNVSKYPGKLGEWK